MSSSRARPLPRTADATPAASRLDRRLTCASPPAPPASRTHLVLIPSYNTGPRLLETVQAARAQWNPVWVVIDGSTDGSGEQILARARRTRASACCCRRAIAARGRRCCWACGRPRRMGYTHALTMDADGQHPADRIPAFMAASQRDPPPWCWAARCSTPVRRASAWSGGAFPTSGRTWRRCGPGSATRCSGCASIRSARCSP